VVLVQVRMVLLREPAVRTLDLVLGRPARDAEPLIVVIVGHVALFPRDGPRSLLVHVLEVRVHDARVRRFARVAGSRRGSFRGSVGCGATVVSLFVFPVAMSFAATFKIPFASISNVTSFFGTLAGAGGMPVS